MNVSEPLDGLTTAVEAAVLRVLARTTTGFSGRQVHSVAGVGSTSSVHRALVGLAEVGLVTAEARPPAIIYRANRVHILWPVVELALTARDRLFESIAVFCTDLLPESSRVTVVVYGSTARRASSLESDIDLFVVYPDDFDDDARAEINYQIAMYVERTSGNPAQVLSIVTSDLAERIAGEDPFVVNVITDGILVFGRPLTGKAGRAA